MDKPKKKSPVLKIVIVIIALIIFGSTIGANSGSSNKNTFDTAVKTQEAKKLSLQETYDKLSKGMTKEAVEAIIGKDSGSCSVTEDQLIGKMESCTYGGSIFDSGMLIITYQNDKIYNKIISKY